MENKICTKCNTDKMLSEFNKKKDSKDGYSSYCKICKKEIDTEYYTKNKDKICENSRIYLKLNPDKVKQSKIKRKDNIKITNKIYREKNKYKIKQIQKEYQLKNKDALSEKHKEYMKSYKLTEEYKKTKKIEYQKNKQENPHILAWRSMLNSTLYRFNKIKEGHTIDLLGYSALELKNYIESLFTDGMSQNNHGEWHIDHIKEVSKFDPDTPMNIVNALSNLRPLWKTTREINGIIYEGNLNRTKK